MSKGSSKETTRQADVEGMSDWDLKCAMLAAALGENPNVKVALDRRAILEYQKDEPNTKLEVKRFADARRKWGQEGVRGPTSEYWNVFQALLAALPKTFFNTKDFLEASPAVFLSVISEPSAKARARAILLESRPGTRIESPGERSARFQQLLVHREALVTPPITECVRKNDVDQRHYWLAPESVTAWGKLVDNHRYPSFVYCLSALKRLCQTPEWKHEIRDAAPRSIVMLAGGGAPQKDIELLHQVLKILPHSDNIVHVTADISLYMLFESWRRLDDLIVSEKISDRVELRSMCIDVVGFSATDREYLRTGTHRALFAMTGGTLGNLDERSVFESLGQVSTEGDLLILSVEKAPTDPRSRDELRSKYDHPTMQQMLAPGIREIVEKCGKGRLVVDSLNLEVSTQRSPAGAPVTIRFEADNGHSIKLLTSRRYDLESLSAFAAEFGWHLKSECCGESPNFVQLLFRRESDGLWPKVSK